MQLLRLKIAPRIIGLVVILLLIMISCFWFAFFKMEDSGLKLREVVVDDFPLVALMTQIATNQLEQTVWLERTLRYSEIIPTEEKAKELLKEAEEEVKNKSSLIDDKIKKAKEIAKNLIRNVSTQDQRIMFETMYKKLKILDIQYTEYKKYISSLFEALDKGNIKQAKILAKNIDEKATELNKNIKEYEKESVKFLNRSLTSIKNLEQDTIRYLGIIGSISIIFGLTTGIFISRGITKKLKEFIVRLKDLATGETDLTKYLVTTAINCSQINKCNNQNCPAFGRETYCWYEVGSYAPQILCSKIKNGGLSSCDECKVYKQAMNTELDEVATFVNAFIIRIRNLIIRIKHQGEKVAEEAQTLSSIAEQLASNAGEARKQAEQVNGTSERTAENISNVAAAMEEMSVTIKEISRNTTHASKIAQEARLETTKAQDVINKLAASSNRISEISKIIGSISEKTKLLALNANIEAARAGEFGKGFAIVANEIKNLTQQTGQSVIEIEEMLNDLKSGVAEAHSAMNNILEVIHQVAEFSNNVAMAIEEQTATTNEISANTQRINHEVKDMVKMSETITTTGNQTSQSAEYVKDSVDNLQNMSNELKKLLGEFKV